MDFKSTTRVSLHAGFSLIGAESGPPLQDENFFASSPARVGPVVRPTRVLLQR